MTAATLTLADRWRERRRQRSLRVGDRVYIADGASIRPVVHGGGVAYECWDNTGTIIGRDLRSFRVRADPKWGYPVRQIIHPAHLIKIDPEP